MTQREPASALLSEQMHAILDSSPVAVYVGALDDGTLLYANRSARELFASLPAMRDDACGPAPDLDPRSPFCRTERMSRDEFLVREFRHPRNGRTYQLSGKLVDWNGRPAHIEYVSDITEALAGETMTRELGRELASADEKMRDIINAIPGGVAIYKISDRYETIYFSEGVPGLSGYTVAEYGELVKGNALRMTFPADTAMVCDRVGRIVATRGMDTFEFRKPHKDGHTVWVRARIKWIGESDGCPLVHVVFHNITDLKDAQLEMEHMLNSIPGGIASYRIMDGSFVPVFCSDGVLALTGYSGEEDRLLAGDDVFQAMYEPDRARVWAAVEGAVTSGEALDISYRIRHKNGSLNWVHLNGRRIDPLGEGMRFNVVLTGMSAESRLFQSLANETADAIFVISRDEQDLLYAHVSEARKTLEAELERASRAAYASWLEARDKSGDLVHRENDRFYSVHLQQTDWNGIPAYVKFVRDITEEETTRREKERLEQYFQTVIKYLPGGVAVVRVRQDGVLVPEFLSEGFATMTGMTLEQAWQLYRQDAMAGVHPDDRERTAEQLMNFIVGGEKNCEAVYRLKKGDGGYVWVKSVLAMIHCDQGESRFYASYRDVTSEREEQERLRLQYNEALLRHYRSPGSDVLVVGHCSLQHDCIYEMVDRTNSNLLNTFGTTREGFFTGLASLVVEEDERRAFLQNYLNAPALTAYEQGRSEVVQECFVKLPGDAHGRHVRFKANLVKAPDGDVTGILTVTDVTEKTISERILQTLSVAGYDVVADVDLLRDRYTVLSGEAFARVAQGRTSRHSAHVRDMLRTQVVPRDRELVARMFDPDYMLERLRESASYSFSFSVTGEKGSVLTKNVMLSRVDLRLGRVCLARTDITDSVREQQGLLNILAHTFEMAALITIQNGRAAVYTRRMVLENLPRAMEDCDNSAQSLLFYGLPDGEKQTEGVPQFRLDTVRRELEEKPSGYDFVLPYHTENGLQYKQITVLWGDAEHKTLCVVRADVTAMLMAERQSKDMLAKALALAEEANRAKSDFLSAMSHDIRTPMNAISGMTALALAHLDKRERVENCLQKISLSSRHLLSLVNDILDMSKIERAKVSLNVLRLSLSDVLNQLSDMLLPQAEGAGLLLRTDSRDVRHRYFYGDALRINQILINILGNAVKFTPEGGRIDFVIKEIEPVRGATHVRYRFRISDTGIGMPEAFLVHLFEPFTRSSGTERMEGSGLGLSIAKGLVELMGGKISVKSRPGQGTSFDIELEFERAPEQESGTNPERDACFNEKILAGRKFLVVEDNAINAEILCELLQMYEANVVLRTDGAQAVQAFESAPPGTYDAILMDVQMPVMNGYDAARAIRRMAREDARRIPIVALTANAFTEDIQAALDAGMDAHVAKPIDMRVLWTTLGRLLWDRSL